MLIVVPAIMGYCTYRNSREEAHEPNLYLLWVCTTIVSIGSCYFHGTLSVAGQVFDELPLMIISIFGMFMYVPVHKWPS